MPSKRKQQRGFTLVEVMVAMLVVGMALPALLDQAERLAAHTFNARVKSQAYWVAQNKMAEININRRLNDETLPRKETDTVQLGREEWRWTVTTQEFETFFGPVTRLEIQVSQAEQEDPQAFLTGFLPGETGVRE